MKNYDIIVIGGGPAGLAAAISAREQGIASVLILERDKELGGILNQCIHNGFGLHTFKEELTGPEYARRYIHQAEELQMEYKLDTMVTDITPEKMVTAMNRKEGLFELKARAIILAMGCRERPRGALNIPGYRPAGIFSAGTAQRLVNMEGYLPGREVVILGSGDIGLIMARRLTLEGAKVKVVAELMPYSGGLKRNIVQCLDDYGIPLKLNHTVIDIRGKERVTGITLAEADSTGKPIPGTEEDYDCDTLLLSVGLIPENELSQRMGVTLNPVTAGPRVNESLETNIEGVFACGNVLHVHDLVDFVSQEAEAAGRNAAAYVECGNAANTKEKKAVKLLPAAGVRYTVPETIHPDHMPEKLTIRFRSDNVYKNCYINVYLKEERILHRKRRIVTPGEMEDILLTKAQLLEASNPETITIMIEEAQTEEAPIEETKASRMPFTINAAESQGNETTKIRTLTCIGCPMGCALRVELSEGQVTGVTGSTCKRGEDYARKEVTNPTRIITSTVRVNGGTAPLVSVKTASDIPKDKTAAGIKALRELKIQAPVHVGDIILENVADSGTNVVATKEIFAEP